MRKGYTLDDLIKAAQEQGKDEEDKDKEKEKKPQGEKSDEELKEEEKKKKQETPPEEEMKTSSLKDLAEGVRACAGWVDKIAEGPVPFSEPTAGGGTQAGGQVTLEPKVEGTQPHPSPTPIPEHDATKVPTLGTGGAMPTTEDDPLTTQTQAQPGDTTATDTGKTTSGTTKSQPIAADQAKVAELGAALRELITQKTAATPIDEKAVPAGDPPAGGGDVGYTEPTEHVPVVSGGDAAATNLTAQQAEAQTQKPDLAPLLVEQPETHAESGPGTPNVDPKLGAWRERLINMIGGE